MSIFAQIGLGIAWEWVKSNPEWTVLALLALAEGITRVTPTKTDDGFVERVGKVIRYTLDKVKLPNVKK